MWTTCSVHVSALAYNEHNSACVVALEVHIMIANMPLAHYYIHVPACIQVQGQVFSVLYACIY